MPLFFPLLFTVVKSFLREAARYVRRRRGAPREAVDWDSALAVEARDRQHMMQAARDKHSGSTS